MFDDVQFWTGEQIPRRIYKILRMGGLLTGSQAKFMVAGLPPDTDKDWDIVVPFEDWVMVRGLIPMSCKPNGYRGWRFSLRGGVEVDVWPDDLRRFLAQATRHSGDTYVIDFRARMIMAGGRRGEDRQV